MGTSNTNQIVISTVNIKETHAVTLFFGLPFPKARDRTSLVKPNPPRI